MNQGQHRRVLDDGRVVVIQPLEDGDWECWIEGEKDAVCVGWPLAPTLADLLGYHVGQEEWPPWIDRWAEEISAVS